MLSSLLLPLVLVDVFFLFCVIASLSLYVFVCVCARAVQFVVHIEYMARLFVYSIKTLRTSWSNLRSLQLGRLFACIRPYSRQSDETNIRKAYSNLLNNGKYEELSKTKLKYKSTYMHTDMHATKQHGISTFIDVDFIRK